MTIDVERLRNDTRGVSEVIHLNNSGASLPTKFVIDAIIEHLKLEESVGPYEAAAEAADRANAFYRGAASVLGCDPSEIAFCDSASRAWNVLVYSLSLKPGDRILVSPLEFGSGLIAVEHIAKRFGCVVEVIPSDKEGRVQIESLVKILSAKKAPALVAITHAAAHSGSINPVREIGKLVKEVGAFYLVDACQSLGQMPVSVDNIQCDALTGTGRKWLRGPRGTGLLYVRKGISESIDPVTTDLVTTEYLIGSGDMGNSELRIRPDARRFELWERSIAGIIGLGVAFDYLQSFISSGVDVFGRILELAQYAADRLRSVEGVDVWAPSKAQSGVVGFLVNGYSPTDVKLACSKKGINISTMGKWDAPLDFQRRGCNSVCRIAPHYFNEQSDIDSLIDVIKGLKHGS